MNYKIAFTQEDPDMDGVSVAQLKNYPLEPEDYKPFAQFRIAASPKGIFVRMLSFEVECCEHSSLAFIIEFDDTRLSMSAEHSGAFAAQIVSGTIKTLHGELPVHYFTGEDLQGVYWGLDVLIPGEVIPNFERFAEEECLCRGNFFKLCRSDRRHFGSFFPCDFEAISISDAPDTPDEQLRLIADGRCGMGDISVVRF